MGILGQEVISSSTTEIQNGYPINITRTPILSSPILLILKYVFQHFEYSGILGTG